MRRVTPTEFYHHLRRAESRANAGTLTRYRPQIGDTLWTVAGQVAGLSLGPVGAGRAYFID